MHTIGVLDSGIGGLTTCCAIFKRIPTINVIYFADNLNAPYGTKNKDDVYRAVKVGVKYLLSRKAEAIVIACNTATAVCIGRLRNEFPVPIIGTEPAVKQANNAIGNTLCLATELTVKNKGSADFSTVDTRYLATLIEGFFDNDKTMSRLVEKAVPNNYDNVVIGCTHYAYLVPYLVRDRSNVVVFDGADGVARQTKRRVSFAYSRRAGRLFLTFSGKREYGKYLRAYRTFSEFCKY